MMYVVRLARKVRRRAAGLLGLAAGAAAWAVGAVVRSPAAAFDLAKRVWWARYYDALRRGLFVFWDGERWRFTDPMAIWHDLNTEAGADFTDLLRLVSEAAPQTADPEAAARAEAEREAAAVRLADIVCKAFDVRPVDAEGGLSHVERIRLAVGYLAFMAEQARTGWAVARAYREEKRREFRAWNGMDLGAN